MGAWGSSLLGVLALGACGEASPDPIPDGGTSPDVLLAPAPPDEGRLADPDFVTPPEPPRLSGIVAQPPEQGPCPEGWAAIDLGAGRACEPPMPRADCPVGAVADIDGTCRRFGLPCPASGYPENLPSGAVVLYVDPGAAPGGDGSPEAPFDRLPGAVAAVPEGAILALRAGDHPGPVALDRPITLWGACASGTRLVGTAEETQAVLRVAGSGAVVRELTLTGPRQGVEVGREEAEVPGASLTLESVLVADVVRRAVSVWPGTELVARDLWVRGVGARPSNGAGGHFLIVEGGRAELSGAVLEHGGRVGVLALGGADVTLDGVAIRRVRQDSEDLGLGMVVAEGAEVTATGLVVEDVFENGVLTLGEARVDADRLIVRSVRPVALALETGVALWSQGAATVELRRSVLRDVGPYAAIAFEPGTTIRLDDTWIADITHYEPTNTVAASDGARLEIRRLWIDDYTGVSARGSGTTAALADLTVRAPPDTPDVAGGRAAVTVAEGAGTVTATAVDAAGTTGITVFDEGTTVRVHGLRVDDPGREPAAAFVREGTLTLSEVELAVSGFQGLAADVGATLIARDVRIRGGRLAVSGNDPRAVELTGVALEAPRFAGVWIIGGESVIRDLEVTDLQEDENGGVALALNGGTARLERLRFTGIEADGLRLMEGTGAEVEDLTVVGAEADELDFAVYVHPEARLSGRRIRVTAMSAGIYANGPADLEDVYVSGRLGAPFNVGIGGSGAIALRRARVEDVLSLGLWSLGPGSIEAEDLVVRGVARVDDDLVGFGVAATEGGQLVLTRARITECGSAGLWAADDAQGVLRDVVVADSLRPECADGTCELASGLFVQDTATVAIERFELLRHPTAGFHVYGEAGIDAREGVVGECGVGLLVEDGVFDASRVSDRVWFRDNQRVRQDREAAFPPVRVAPPSPPDPTDPLGG